MTNDSTSISGTDFCISLQRTSTFFMLAHCVCQAWNAQNFNEKIAMMLPALDPLQIRLAKFCAFSRSLCKICVEFAEGGLIYAVLRFAAKFV